MAYLVALLGGWRATAFAVLAILALSATGVQTLRVRNAAAEMTAHLAADAQANLAAQITARAREQEFAAATAKIAQDFEKAKQDAQATSDAVVASLRAGTLKLRGQWLGCQADLSTVGAGPAVIDAAAADRAAGAANLVRIAREADTLITALQAIVRADRAQPTK